MLEETTFFRSKHGSPDAYVSDLLDSAEEGDRTDLAHPRRLGGARNLHQAFALRRTNQSHRMLGVSRPNPPGKARPFDIRSSGMEFEIHA